MKIKKFSRQFGWSLFFAVLVTTILGVGVVLLTEQADVVHRGNCTGKYATTECLDKKIRKLELEKEYNLKLKELEDEYKK